MTNDVRALRNYFIKENKPTYKPSIGDKVYVNSLNAEGVIMGREDGKIKVKLMDGSITYTIPSDLTHKEISPSHEDKD